VSFITMETGFTTAHEHIDAVQRFRRVAADLGESVGRPPDRSR
jgi:hypothetical protein